jgi:hypothetical protein
MVLNIFNRRETMDTNKLESFKEKLEAATSLLSKVIEGGYGSKKAGKDFRKLATEIRKEIPDVKRETIDKE